MNQLCFFCRSRVADQYHHLFPQTKVNIKIYGKKLIDSEWNKVPACAGCNSSHANVIVKNEVWFRSMAIKNGVALPPPSKTLSAKFCCYTDDEEIKYSDDEVKDENHNTG